LQAQDANNLATEYPLLLNPNGGNVGIGTSDPQKYLHMQHGSTNAFTPSNDSWHSVIVHNNASAATNTAGIAFEVSGNAYHGNAGTGIAAVKNGTNSDYGADLVFITRPQSAVAAERMRIDSAGRVGIKTTPSAWGADYAVLDLNTGGSIYGTTSGVTTSSNLYFTGSSWIAKNTGLGTLYAQHTGKHIWYSSASVSAGSGAPLVQKMVLDASGNLLVGKSAAGFANTGHELRGGGSYAAFTRDGGTPVLVNRKSSDGTLVEYMKDGSAVGSIGTEGSDLAIGNGDAGLQFINGTQSVRPFNMTTNARLDAQVDLGMSSTRFKDLYLSGGAYLGGTGAANKLDDYEEGTWVPALTCTTTDPTPTAVTVNSANYTKIGNTVFIRAYIAVSLTNVGSGTAKISGLPFTVKSGTYNPVFFTHGSLIHSSGGYFASGTTIITAIGNNSVGSVPFAGTGQRYLMISGQYEVA
jgi:hypothetical protein